MVKMDNRKNENTTYQIQTWVTMQVREWRMKYEVLCNSGTDGTSLSHSVTTHAYVTTRVCVACSVIMRWVVAVRGWFNVLSSGGAVQVKNRRASHYESVSARGAALLKRHSQMLEVPHSHSCSVSIQLPSPMREKTCSSCSFRGDDCEMITILSWLKGWMRWSIMKWNVISGHFITDCEKQFNIYVHWIRGDWYITVCHDCKASAADFNWVSEHAIYVRKIHLV